MVKLVVKIAYYNHSNANLFYLDYAAEICYNDKIKTAIEKLIKAL